MYKSWFPTPKKLLKSKKYKNLPIYAKVILPHLFSLNNTSKENWFYQTQKSLKEHTGLSRYHIRRGIETLHNIDVSIKKEGHKYYFNLSNLFQKY